MHSVHPAFVVDLCEKIYGAAPLPFLLHIRGFEFDLAEGFSDEARSNLRKSFEFVKSVLKHPGYLVKRFETEINGHWLKDLATPS